MSPLYPLRPEAPHLDRLRPEAALPGGTFEVTGSRLAAQGALQLPRAFFGETEAATDLLRPGRVQVWVQQEAIGGYLTLRNGAAVSNRLHANVAIPIADDLQ